MLYEVITHGQRPRAEPVKLHGLFYAESRRNIHEPRLRLRGETVPVSHQQSQFEIRDIRPFPPAIAVADRIACQRADAEAHIV